MARRSSEERGQRTQGLDYPGAGGIGCKRMLDEATGRLIISMRLGSLQAEVTGYQQMAYAYGLTDREREDLNMVVQNLEYIKEYARGIDSSKT